MTTAIDAKPKRRFYHLWTSYDPFVAPDSFASSFQIAWDTLPACGKCGKPIKGEEGMTQ